MSMSYSDCFEFNVESACCGASIYIDGRCAECLEHTEPAEMDSEEEKEIILEKLKDFESPSYETSLAKGLPMGMLDKIKSTFPGEFLYRYRGPSTKTFRRSPFNTIMEHATSFALYYK